MITSKFNFNNLAIFSAAILTDLSRFSWDVKLEARINNFPLEFSNVPIHKNQHYAGTFKTSDEATHPNSGER
jgi:hypothetical protein